MDLVEPSVRIIARPTLDIDEVSAYLREVGGERWLVGLDRSWTDGGFHDAQALADLADRLPRGSWAPGPAPASLEAEPAADSRPRDDGHGSAGGSFLDHVHFSFVLRGVRRTLARELARPAGSPARPDSSPRPVAPGDPTVDLLWTADLRTLRHAVESRTAPEADRESRLLFGRIGELLRGEVPELFGDFTVRDGSWVPSRRGHRPEVDRAD
ncbi:hypothetical protein AB0O91_28000 [Kitasatospora sp. NPDC089797]|uniref:hypothetical protein n=1 Tax=Kitasatospora sp. NPDC089797 TaxID=3155298 RepID=UPI003416CABE